MAEKFDALNEKHIQFIQKQHLYFIGSAAAEGLVNVSPKGMDSLRVVSSTKVAWLNLTGSGNETAAHMLENNRMTIMFCSFDKQPLILRLYGHAKVIHPRDRDWKKMYPLFSENVGARQIFEVDIEMVLTSCGYAVPYYEFKGERQTLVNWSVKKGREGVAEYWEEKNQKSLDDKDTGIFD
ncbi:MAG: pyridoxamine 5'-phosphate oxidase family protein [Cellvibrionaceae bacterium]